MKTLVRFLIAPWYLLGWILHVYLAIYHPEIYAKFGTTALIPALGSLWSTWIMPNIVYLALTLAAFELLVGYLLIGKGEQVKYGLVASLFFNAFLVVLGLSGQATHWLSDFLINRLPNLIFVVIQIPLLSCRFEESLGETASSLLQRFSHA